MTKKRNHSTATVTKHFVVAMEGIETEPKYFDAVRKRFKLTNVTLISNRGKGLSPKQLIQRLDSEKRQVRLTRERDAQTEYWAVFDHEKVPYKKVQEIVSMANRKGYFVADSKPCFELWLLLHYGTRARFKGIEASGDNPACLPSQRHLEKVDKSYDRNRKGKYKASCYMGKIRKAIIRAETLDQSPHNQALQDIGTRVYLLLRSIIE